MHNITLYNYSV